MKKNIVTLLFSVMMIVILTAGCNKSDINNSTSEDNTVTTTEEEVTASPEDDSAAEDDPDHYKLATDMDKGSVEKMCLSIKEAYLNEEWEKIADNIWYPITVNGTRLDDKNAFLDYMENKTIDESDKDAMNDETCHDMFVNGQGICMGSGQIWLNDPSYMTDKAPVLQIISINGIIER